MSDRGILLLVGTDGFVGTHVRVDAEAAGLRVIGASRNPREGDLRCDLTEPASVGKAIRRSAPDLVVNMAGFASVAESWRSPNEAFTVNATGVVNLLEAVASYAPRAHITCVSSAEVYGAATEEELPFCEDHPLEPINPYGASKAAMEIICGQYTRSRGLQIAIVRAFNQLGPGQSPQFAASDFARQVATAELAGEATIDLDVGNTEVARDFTDVRDAARAYVAIAGRRLAGTYNLCSERAVALHTLVDEIGRSSPLVVRINPRSSRSRPTDIPLIIGSAARLREATRWTPEIPLRRTVSDLVDWWRSQLREAGTIGDADGTGVPA